MADEEVQAAMRTRRAEALRRVMDTAAELRRAAEALENAADSDLGWLNLIADSPNPNRSRELESMKSEMIRRVLGASTNTSIAIIEVSRLELAHRV